MIKMVVTDVDRTIVDKDEVLQEQFVNYVKNLKEQGIYYTVATGRAAGLVKEYIDRMQIEIPYIACNGGTIVENGRVIMQKTIPLKNLRQIFNAADKMGMSLMYSINGMEYAYKETPYVLEQQRLYGRYKNPRLISEEEWEGLAVDKVIVMAAVRDGSIGVIEDLCKALPDSYLYKRYADKAIDILHFEATKEYGVKELAKLMDISLDEILFAGDDLNDVQIIRQAGVGVAVGNAQQPAKNAADYIAKENCWLGVMEAVDKFTGRKGMRIALDNSLRRQSYSLPCLLEEQFDDLKKQADLLFTDEELKGIDQIILTGCGDSYAAGLTLRYELEKLTGITTELVTAIDFSRYYIKKRLSEKTLVIIISISGNGARILEVVKKAGKSGAVTLAITRNRDSDIGNTAEKVFELHISRFESGPGNRNYFVSLLALILFGIRTGYVRKVISDEEMRIFYDEIHRQGKVLEDLLPKIDDGLFELAKAWKDKRGFDFVGSGMDYGNAWFSHAKILEITGAFAMHINSEEWFHMNNFVKSISSCGTMMLASVHSPGFSRTKEAVRYAARLGRPLCVITDGSSEDFEADAYYIQIPHSDFMPAMSLVQYVPVCILAGYMGAMLGERNCRGCLGPWEFAAGGKYIRNSEMTEDD